MQFRALVRYNLTRLFLVGCLAILLGYLPVVFWLYESGSTTVDYAHARMQAEHAIQSGAWSQEQAEQWLRPHAMLFWHEVSMHFLGYLEYAVPILIGACVIIGIRARLALIRPAEPGKNAHT